MGISTSPRALTPLHPHPIPFHPHLDNLTVTVQYQNRRTHLQVGLHQATKLLAVQLQAIHMVVLHHLPMVLHHPHHTEAPQGVAQDIQRKGFCVHKQKANQ